MYGFNRLLIEHFTKIAHIDTQIEKEKQAINDVMEKLGSLWQAHHPNRHRVRGMNLGALVNDIKRTGRSLPPWQSMDEASGVILERLMERAGAKGANAQEMEENLQIWINSSGIDTIIRPRGGSRGPPRVRQRYGQSDRLIQDLQAQKKTLRARTKRFTIEDDDQYEGAKDAPEAGDFVRLNDWSHLRDHVVDEEGETVRFDEHRYWQNPKTTFGEQTTEKEKARAFRHYVRVMQNGGPLLVLRLDDTPIDPTANHCDAMRYADHTDGGHTRYIPAHTLVQCIYHQWSNLRVLVDPVNEKVVRVEGKQGDHKDDVWMAFSIGMQWCARFCLLLHTRKQRSILVNYMRQLTRMAQRALELGEGGTHCPSLRSQPP